MSTLLVVMGLIGGVIAGSLVGSFLGDYLFYLWWHRYGKKNSD